MNISTIRVRYAKAFFSVAKEKKMIETLKADAQMVLDLCKQSNELVLLFESPVVSTSKKIELIIRIFKQEINTITLDFLLLIAKNKREAYIPGICINFLDLIKKDQNIKTAVLTTATKVVDKTLGKIKAVMEKELNSKVEITGKVDPEIIGGLILRVEDKQFDSSVTTQLKKIKQHLLETEVKK
jgi:F-type H+-transporting ATPase subunit delta